MHGPVRVPDEAASAVAKVTLSFPDWAEGCIRPATLLVPVMDAEPAPKK